MSELGHLDFDNFDLKIDKMMEYKRRKDEEDKKEKKRIVEFSLVLYKIMNRLNIGWG